MRPNWNRSVNMGLSSVGSDLVALRHFKIVSRQQSWISHGLTAVYVANTWHRLNSGSAYRLLTGRKIPETGSQSLTILERQFRRDLTRCEPTEMFRLSPTGRVTSLKRPNAICLKIGSRRIALNRPEVACNSWSSEVRGNASMLSHSFVVIWFDYYLNDENLHGPIWWKIAIL